MRPPKLTRIGRDEAGICADRSAGQRPRCCWSSPPASSPPSTGSTRATAQERLAPGRTTRTAGSRAGAVPADRDLVTQLEPGGSSRTAPSSRDVSYDGPQSSSTCYTISSQSQFHTETGGDEHLRIGNGLARLPAAHLSVTWTGMGPAPPGEGGHDRLAAQRLAGAEQRLVLVNVDDSQQQRHLRRHAHRQWRRLLQRHHGPDRLRALAEPPGRDLLDDRVGGGPRRHGRPERQRAGDPDRERRRPGDQHDHPAVRPAGIDPQRQLPDRATTRTPWSVVGRLGDRQQHRHEGREAVHAARRGTRSIDLDQPTLFPFTSPYSVYAGTCDRTPHRPGPDARQRNRSRGRGGGPRRPRPSSFRRSS